MGSHDGNVNASTRPLNSRRRDEAVDRLRSLTVGTAVAGLVATGAFGALASFYYSGQVTSANADTSGNGGSSSTSENRSVPLYAGSNGPQNGSGNAPSTKTNVQPFQAVQAPTTHLHAYVSTGGSGGG
jgi:hypothetical protein